MIDNDRLWVPGRGWLRLLADTGNGDPARPLQADELAALHACLADRGRYRPPAGVPSAPSAALVPFVAALVADVSEKGRKRLKHVHTLKVGFDDAGAAVLTLQGGQPPSAADRAAMQAAARAWIAAFEQAAHGRVHEMISCSPWRGDVPAAEPVPVHDLRAVAAGVLAARILPEWQDDEPRAIRFLFQVLAESAVGCRLPADTWLTRGGLYWYTPTSRTCVEAVTAALRAWLSGPGQRLFERVNSASVSFDIDRPEPFAQAA